MSFRTLNNRIDQAVATLAEQLRERPLRLAVSGGKDSTVCVALALRAARDIKHAGVDPMPIFMGSSDTGVENPEVSPNRSQCLAHVSRNPWRALRIWRSMGTGPIRS